MAGVVLIAVGISLVVISGADNDADSDGDGATGDTGATGQGATPDGLKPIKLPLNLDLVGFDEGTVTATSPSEGPAATSYCNNAPEASGLLDWRGNRMTDSSGRQRVAQLVARFGSSSDADAYLTESSALVDCESWTTTAGDDDLTFTVTEQEPSQVYGDETKRFDLQATAGADGPDLHLRTVLTRSNEIVAQFTFVSADPDEIDELAELAELGTTALGF